MTEKNEPELEKRVEIAEKLADKAREVIAPYFKSRDKLSIEHKDAASPIVTRADKESEYAMREIIEAHFPEDSIVGEEYGQKEGESGYQWILDPVDGTIAFSVGKPVFGSLIALVKEERFVLGIIEQPVLKERYLGFGGKTFLNGYAIETSTETELQKASLTLTSPINGDDAGRVGNLIESVHVTSYGGDCYNYALLAAGHVDIVLEKGLAYYDYAALVPVVKGAGGLITDWQGAEIKPGKPSDILASCNETIHQAVIELLKNR